MAIGALIKNKNFIAGFSIGFIFTLGRAWVPIIEQILRPLFDFWNLIWPEGLVLEIIPFYISGFVIFLVVRYIFFRGQESDSLAVAFKFFSLGFLASFALFIALALIAISQFRFTQ